MAGSSSDEPSSHYSYGYSSINYESPSSKSSNLPTPTPAYIPICPPQNHHTGYTPENKRTRRNLFPTPSTKEKIDDLHHYQRETLELQCEMHYEQKSHGRRLSFLERCAAKICGASPINTNAHIHSPQRPHASPNSWERGGTRNSPIQKECSPIKLFVENTKIEPGEES